MNGVMKKKMTYKNGNTIVKIEEDGTKIRYTPDGQEPCPEFPESIDIKITNRCDTGCPMCHEMSVKNGAFGNLEHPLLDSIPAGTELAIGGGNPLEHPDLIDFLEKMKDKGVICNLTVHHTHFALYCNTLKKWQEHGLIHGIGVSANQIMYSDILDVMRDWPNLVVHTIAGLATPEILKQFESMNLLILGYKIFGRGLEYFAEKDEDISDNIEKLSESILELIPKYKAVCFDNLAVKQLRLKEKLSPEKWNEFYMGDDGEFTMYVDLVKEEYAKSSTSVREKIDNADIRQLFKQIRS